MNNFDFYFNTKANTDHMLFKMHKDSEHYAGYNAIFNILYSTSTGIAEARYTFNRPATWTRICEVYNPYPDTFKAEWIKIWADGDYYYCAINTGDVSLSSLFFKFDVSYLLYDVTLLYGRDGSVPSSAEGLSYGSSAYTHDYVEVSDQISMTANAWTIIAEIPLKAGNVYLIDCGMSKVSTSFTTTYLGITTSITGNPTVANYTVGQNASCNRGSYVYRATSDGTLYVKAFSVVAASANVYTKSIKLN